MSSPVPTISAQPPVATSENGASGRAADADAEGDGVGAGHGVETTAEVAARTGAASGWRLAVGADPHAVSRETSTKRQERNRRMFK